MTRPRRSLTASCWSGPRLLAGGFVTPLVIRGAFVGFQCDASRAQFGLADSISPLWMRPGTLVLGNEERQPHRVSACRVMAPEGHENLRDLSDVADALVDLRRRSQLRLAVVKLDEGFSGEGNAVYV